MTILPPTDPTRAPVPAPGLVLFACCQCGGLSTVFFDGLSYCELHGVLLAKMLQAPNFVPEPAPPRWTP